MSSDAVMVKLKCMKQEAPPIDTPIIIAVRNSSYGDGIWDGTAPESYRNFKFDLGITDDGARWRKWGVIDEDIAFDDPTHRAPLPANP